MRYDNFQVIKHHLSMLKECEEVDAHLSMNKPNGNTGLKRFVCMKSGDLKSNDLARASLLGTKAGKISCKIKEVSIEKEPESDCSIKIGDKLFVVKRIANLSEFEDIPNCVYVFRGDIKRGPRFNRLPGGYGLYARCSQREA
jgi:hypothetical protein